MSILKSIKKAFTRNKEEPITEEPTPETNYKEEYNNLESRYEKEILELKKQYNTLKKENKDLKKENNKILDSIDEKIENKLKEKKEEENEVDKKNNIVIDSYIDDGIYDPLPEEYKTPNLVNFNKTGFAWVSQVKNQNNYFYNRQRNGKQVAFRANNIYKLYLKVVKNGHPWGILDYNKASKLIDIPESVLSKNNIKSNNKSDDNDEDNLIVFNKYWKQLINKHYRRRFKYLYLENGVLFNKSVEAYLQLNQIKYIKNNLTKFENRKYSLKDIFNELDNAPDNYNTNTFAQWIYNIVIGSLDNYITKKEEDTEVLSKTEYLDKIFTKSYRVPLKNKNYTLLTNNEMKVYAGSGKKLNIKVDTVEHLQDNFDNYCRNDYDFNDIYNEIKDDLLKVNPNFIMKRDGIKLKILTWNIFQGYFNDKKEEEMKNNNVSTFKPDKNYYRTMGIGRINQKKFTYPFILKGNEAVADYKGIDLYFVMDDIISLKNKLLTFKSKNYTVTEIKEALNSKIDYSSSDFQKLIYNFYTNPSLFDDLIEEYNDYLIYLDDTHVYSTDGEVLIIDDTNTGLTLAKCNMLINDYINADNKQICLHNIIRLNEDLNPKYICLIFRMYNENMFMKLLKQDKPQVVMINNPQKRRENKLY